MALGNPLTRWIYAHSPSPFQNYLATIYSRGRGRRKFGHKFEEYLADLERLQWYDNAGLLILQDECIRRLAWQAGQFVPYYEAQFKSLGISPTQVRSRDDITLLPILEKSVVQTRVSDFVSSLYARRGNSETIHSSGTTGKAIDVVVGLDYLKLEKAYVWLQRKWRGLKPGDSTAYFTGHPIVSVQRRKPPFWVYDASENRTFFSLQHMSKANLGSYSRQLARLNPALLVGYPTAIYLMALFLREEGITTVRPRGIFTASETLLPHQRQMIEQAFGCKVMDLYGQAEYCGMILQCEQGNYHIQELYGVMEILGKDWNPVKPGEIGEIICSGLNNMAMPFIRYRTGDTAVPKAGTCACGRGGRLVERITGRLEDVIVTPDGRFLSRLDFVFKEMPFVQEAQMIQETRELLRVRIVPLAGFSTVDMEKVKSNLQERAGKEMRIEFEVVEQIPRLPNGKFRYVISKVPLDYSDARQTGEIIGVTREEDKTL